MKRIVHWTDGFAPIIGGTEILILELARAQRRAGHQVCVVAESLPNCPDEAVLEGIPVHRFPFTPTLLSRNLAALRELVDRLVQVRTRLSPHHVHVHFNAAAAWFERLSRPSGPAPILTVHTAPDGLRVPIPIRRQILRSAAWVVAVSRPQMAELATFEPGTRACLTCIPNGLTLPPPPSEAPHGLSSRPFRFAALGRLVESKGFQTALDAFTRVHLLYPGASELHIAGNGAARQGLIAKANSLGAASRHITFPGWIPPDEVHAWLQQANVVLVPTPREESFGLVALQAALAARPVIASSVGGLADIVVDKTTGWLVPPSDPQALADRMAACIQSPGSAQAIGSNARSLAVNRYSIERCRDEYDRLYRSPGPTTQPPPTHEDPLLV